MGFDHNVTAAARRHLSAAQTLDHSPHRGVAGYLYGIAAECAVKAMMMAVPLRIDDAFFAHFPNLRTLLRDHCQGRNSQTLARFIRDDAFMNHWDIKMRYADARQIEDRWVSIWAEQASHAVNAMGT
jgi:hypothetical protein